MKLTADDVRPVEKLAPLALFHQGIKSPITDQSYTRVLKKILCNVCEDVLEGTFEERVEEFVRRSRADPAWCRDVIMGISRLMRGRTELPRDHPDYLNPSSFHAYFSPVKKLLDMNDIAVQWKSVYRTYPERRIARNSRGWTRAEIVRLLACAEGAKRRTVILILASSGMRLGGMDLRWDDFSPIYGTDDSLSESDNGGEIACAAVRVYRESAEEYTTFITPEAWGTLQKWRAVWTHAVGRQPKPDDCVFKRNGSFPKPLTMRAIKISIDKIISRSGIRDGHVADGRRYDVPAIHGFRRFWNKTVKDALSDDSPISALTKKEYMLGHSGMTALDRNYYHTNTLELAKEYIKAVPALTIGNEDRLRLEARRNACRNLEQKNAQDRIANLEKMVKELSAQLASVQACSS